MCFFTTQHNKLTLNKHGSIIITVEVIIIG